jgi:hypothetical protein
MAAKETFNRNLSMEQHKDQIGSMPAHEFTAMYAPSEYSESWDKVTEHPEFDRDEDGNKAYHAMVEDMKVNGMNSPVNVKTPENKVQDGHHRVAAAMAAGVPVKFTTTDKDMWDDKQLWEV